jgi:hypothetical protein
LLWYRDILKYFSTNPKVTKGEIMKVPKIIMQTPATYHSRVKFSSMSAISERAKNRKIKAKTERNPRIAVTVAENLNFFIFLIGFYGSFFWSGILSPG